MKKSQEQKKDNIDLNNGQKSSNDLQLSKPSFEKIEIQILAVSQEISLAREAPASQEIKSQLKEEQADSKKSAQELETKTLLAKVAIKATDSLQEPSLTGIKIDDLDAEKTTSIDETSSATEPSTITKPLVSEQNLEERPLTPINCEAKSLGNDADVYSLEVPATPVANELFKESLSATNGEASKSSEKSSEVTTTPLAKELQVSVVTSISGQASSDEKPASSKCVQVKLPPVTRPEDGKGLYDGIPAVKPRFEGEITLKTSEVISQNYRASPSVIVTDVPPLRTPAASNSLQQTLTAPVQPPTPVSHIETEKVEAKLCTVKAETPPTSKQIAETIVRNHTCAVKPRLENGITLKTHEVKSQNCRDIPSVVAADISPIQTTTLAEIFGQQRATTAEAPKSLLAQPSTVLKEQRNPVTTSVCSEPNTRSTAIQLPDVLKIHAWKEKPSLTESKTNKSPETSSSEKAKSLWQISLDEAQGERSLLGRPESRKRRGGTPQSEDDVLTKKWRSSSPANVHLNSAAFSFLDQSCSAQLMDIGGLTPAVSSLNMEVDSSGILPFAFNLTFNRFPSVLNTQNGQNISEDMELCDSGSSLIMSSQFGRNQQSSRPLFGCQPFGLSFASSSQPTGQSSFGFNQETSQQFSFGNSFCQTGIQARQTAFTSLPQAPPLLCGGFNQTGNRVFGSQVPSAMFVIPKAPPLPVGGLGNINNQQFTFGSAPCQTTQSPSVFGGSFNQAGGQKTFANPSILKLRPTLFKSDRPPREFLFNTGLRRCKEAKPWFNLNQTKTQPQVFGFQPNPQQVFGSFGMMQSPTPMESEDVSNLGGSLFGGQNNQPASCGQVIFGSQLSTPGQNTDDHSMEDVLEKPSLNNGMLPYRATASCFAMSCQTMETRPSPQRTLSLPQMSVTSALKTPASPLIKPARLQLPSSSFAGKTFTKNVLQPSLTPSGTSTSVSCGTFTTGETITNVSRQSFQPNLKENEVLTKLHKIYSSVSSLCSTTSNLSDCESEIDALIETLSDSVSSCSLEDDPEPNELGKLAAKLETLSIVD